MARLFSSDSLTDTRGIGRDEGIYPFLNRVGTPYFQRVRDLIEEWFDELPTDPSSIQGDLRARLTSRVDSVFTAAFWELFLHASLTRGGLRVAFHPTVSGSRSRPDFLVVDQNGNSLFLEAKVAERSREEILAANRLSTLHALLNKTKTPNFFLAATFFSVGPDSPPAGPVRRLLEAWLDSLDPDKVVEDVEKHGRDALPTFPVEHAGWFMQFRAHPKGEGARGKPMPAIGMWTSGRVRSIKTDVAIRRACEVKATKYGKLDLPYVIAVLADLDFFAEDHVAEALFGTTTLSVVPYSDAEPTPGRQGDGFWTTASGPKNEGVSAVLALGHLRPWSVASARPSLWANPWSSHPISIQLPWPRLCPNQVTGILERLPAVGSTSDLLGLPRDWPGPEQQLQASV